MKEESGKRSPSFPGLAAATLSLLCAACGGGGGTATPPPPSPGGIPTTFAKQTIDLSLYPDAVCNDGSPAIFYIQRGQGADAAANADKTIVGLQGGGYCLTDAECATRPSELISSNGYPAETTAEGLLSGDASNDRFRSWNRVRVPYCSSDFFSGDVGPTGGSTNFRFRGAKIVTAVVQTINRQYGIGKAGDTVILAGGSAGAVGVFINANRVRAALSGASVLAVIDAGVYPDVPPPVPGTPPRESVRDLGDIGLAYWNGQLDADCVAANPAEPGLCYLFEHAQASLRTPFFVIQNVSDAVGIVNVGLLDSEDRLDNSTVARWINSTYLPGIGGTMRGLGLTTGQGVFAVCQGANVHTLSSTTASWTSPFAELGGAVLKDAVASWAAGGGTATRLLTPSCSFP